MHLDDRNHLIDLIPDLLPRADFENLLERIGRARVLRKVPGNASYETAVTTIVNRAIAGRWIGALVDALTKESNRPELVAIRKRLDENPEAATPPIVPNGARRWIIVVGTSGVVAAGVVTPLLWPKNSAPKVRDAAVDARATVASMEEIDKNEPYRAPQGMVWIPPARVTLGSTDHEVQTLRTQCTTLSNAELCKQFDSSGFWQREVPQRSVNVPGFFLDRTEVTVRDVASWLDGAQARVDGNRIELGGVVIANLGVIIHSKGHFRAREGLEAVPVVDITWEGAARFCDTRGAALPTADQWERAARGTKASRFPWGDEQPTCADAVLARGVGRCPGAQIMVPAGGGLKDRSREGVLDLAGNVSEWVKDVGTNPGDHEVRGGSYAAVWLQARSAARRFVADSAVDVGFRCAISTGGEK